MKIGWALAYGVVCSFLVAGILYLATRPPRGQAVELLPAPTPAPILIHISGAVARPGVYSLPPGSRVKDAVEAAGGFLTEANQGNINQAAILRDGQQVNVLFQVVEPTAGAGNTSPTTAGNQNQNTPGKLININIASLEELDSLPGIGPALAQRIIDYRNNTPFSAIEEIQDVSGIGPAVFERIKGLITVDW